MPDPQEKSLDFSEGLDQKFLDIMTSKMDCQRVVREQSRYKLKYGREGIVFIMP